jgi:hypothetical protein
MAQYLLLLYDNPANWQNLSPEDMQKALEKYIAWGNKVRKLGIHVGSDKLTDGAGRVIRGSGSKARVTDGPFSEGKEVLGGYYAIEAESYDKAVEVCRDHPHLEYGGTIEVREVDRSIPQ